MDTKVILIRHAESVKNLKDIHGGSGEVLTDLGKVQCKGIAQMLMQRYINKVKVFCCPSVHTIETAKIIANIIGEELNILKYLEPLHLGIINGKSNAYVKENYLDVYNQLTMWRNQEIEVCELCIPEMENVYRFWERGKLVFNSLQEGKINLIVCTNSLAILLCNMMLKRTPKRGSGYKHINIINCGIMAFDTCDFNEFVIDKDITNIVI